jgi:hypothetical protein
VSRRFWLAASAAVTVTTVAVVLVLGDHVRIAHDLVLFSMMFVGGWYAGRGAATKKH